MEKTAEPITYRWSGIQVNERETEHQVVIALLRGTEPRVGDGFRCGCWPTGDSRCSQLKG